MDQTETPASAPNDTFTELDISMADGFTLPEFMENNIRLWFVLLESRFITQHITSDKVRFHLVINFLPIPALKKVSDIVGNPENGYEQLKARLIEEYERSKTIEALRVCELGDRKPSVLLRDMRHLAKDKTSKHFLRAAFLQQLPKPVQVILAEACHLDLEDVAMIADRLMEYEFKPSCKTLLNSTGSDTAEEMKALMNKLLKQMNRLHRSLKNLQRRQHFSRSRSRSCSRSRSRSKNRNQTRTPQGFLDNICYYHQTFGRDARKCRSPCSFRACR